ncbi:MAG: NAD(P)-dependent oxidoreductase [Rhizobiales bacterium]|nr:NAD(P)-dependent oxidoreductase [Hyphomicrobiales bacterium]
MERPPSLKGKTLFITGASRGIGLAIALRAARDGANIAIAAKTVEPHPRLEGTIHTAAAEIEAAGGNALALACDIRDETQIAAAAHRTAETFGGIDICINNASAISLTSTLDTPAKRYDLMHAVNGRGTFLVSQACLPHLLKAPNGHILTLAPPLDLDPKWFAPHVAYTTAKYAMSLISLGLAAEFAGRVAVNCLWPRTLIATAAVRNVVGGVEAMRRARKPAIMADAAYAILVKNKDFTGHFLIDDSFLASEGVNDFDQYRVDPACDLMQDFFVPAAPPAPASLKASR